MIHDAKVEVTCDGTNCDEFIEITPHIVYLNGNPDGGVYDTSDRALEKQIESSGWIISDDKQYCSEYCAQAMESYQ
jgi:hypothetical protein